MKSLRTVLSLLTALSLAALALPSFAVTKTYSLNADASGIQYNTDSNNLRSLQVPAPITAVIKNESPPGAGSSNISSFTVTVTGMVITWLDTTTCQSQAGMSAMCSLDPTGHTVTVTNINPPIQGQGTFSVPVSVNSCGDGAWSAKVWTGSSLNGQMFGLVNDTSLPTNLATNVSCGDAACGSAFTAPNALATPGSPLYVNGIRDKYNKDGSTCSTVNYFVTNTIPQDSTLRFQWDTIQPSAAMRYTLNYPAPVNPYFSWLNSASGAPVFVAAQPCLATNTSNGLPWPYGALSQGVNSNKSKIQVSATSDSTLPIAVPFPILVDTERMVVTDIGTNFWTVMRGQGGTVPAPHSAGALVMSTPRPLLVGPFDSTQSAAGYKVGDQAHGCIASPDPSQWPGMSYDVIDIDDILTLGR